MVHVHTAIRYEWLDTAPIITVLPCFFQQNNSTLGQFETSGLGDTN